MDMSAFIALMVMRSAEESVEAGQDKYRAYFINTHLYRSYQDATDTILETEGHGELIVDR